MDKATSKRKGSPWWYLLALIPLIGTLFPEFYSSVTPTLWGIPFFYWYQMLWVMISSLVTFIMYLILKEN
ncbi:DUF3311 domain-containing protein [Alicyclobacillus fodiniaquatilis]|uniref:DUF3311 domain-containing protein n=1 Tax=Alicyclobacillus fodiniaquatilis TaxID=1661150 RepID=A0ABW4JJ29_9BACL